MACVGHELQSRQTSGFIKIMIVIIKWLLSNRNFFTATFKQKNEYQGGI